jgi:PEP-CTERM motif
MHARRSIWVSSLLLVACSAASALEISAATASACFGLSTCSLGGATLTAAPGPIATIAEQNLLGLRGIGVAFAAVGNPLRQPEIQGDPFAGSTESLTISFASPQRVTAIGIGHLQNPDLFSTDAREIASISAFGALGTATLNIQSISMIGGLGTGFLASDASLFGELVRLDAGTGEFRVLAPFAKLGPIDKFVFTAPNTPTAGGDNSDFSVTLIQTQAVPEPATMRLMLMGLLVAIGKALVKPSRRMSA